jgi:uncharacterized BrkB/YihY/UPF0761 family membrane protein
MDSPSIKIDYTLPILDITVVILTIVVLLVTIFIGIYSIHIAQAQDNHIQINQSSNDHLLAIRRILEQQTSSQNIN